MVLEVRVVRDLWSPVTVLPLLLDLTPWSLLPPPLICILSMPVWGCREKHRYPAGTHHAPHSTEPIFQLFLVHLALSER